MGDFMVLVGPSGSGKSTALQMVAGLEEVTSGEIRIGDRVVNDLPPRDRDIAMVFQNYALYPNMTVEENLAFGLRLHKTSKDEQRRRVAEAARILSLEPFLKRKPAALSGGQRQRVAMGRAIVRDPQAFLMDEPLSSLDAPACRMGLAGSQKVALVGGADGGWPGRLARTSPGSLTPKKMTKGVGDASIRTGEKNAAHVDGYTRTAASWARPGSAR